MNYVINFENVPEGASSEFLHYDAELNIGTLVIKTSDGGENYKYCSKEQASNFLGDKK